MSQIDWSKAPEGATHFLPEQVARGWVACWYKNIDGTWFARNTHDCDWYPDHDYQEVFIPLLIERQPVWTGEGLPPVGTKVEIEAKGLRIWEEAEAFLGRVVEVVSTFRLTNTDMVVVYLEEENACCVFRASMCRMPKTPEQIAAQARSKACDEMFGIMSSPPVREGNRSDMAEALYDAGYRKFEIVDE